MSPKHQALFLSVLLTACASHKKSDPSGDGSTASTPVPATVAPTGAAPADTSTTATTAADTSTSTSAATATKPTPKASTESISLPLVSPPVKAAAPAGFKAGASLGLADLDPSDIKSRFFTNGPTDLFFILSNIDGQITGINQTLADHDPDCVHKVPVEYDLKVAGTTIPFYAQCSRTNSDSTDANPDFMQFAVTGGATYIYVAGGAEHVAAIVTPVASSAGAYTVQAWIGVGYNNATSCGTSGKYDGCSYGMIEFTANSATQSFEMAVAGIGFGYCGAQLQSNGTDVYATGSIDGPGCSDVASLCVLASDVATPATCSSALQTFALPSLGRVAVTGSQAWQASTYPATPNILLDGTASDALGFGPTAPAAGTEEVSSGSATSTGSGTSTGT